MQLFRTITTGIIDFTLASIMADITAAAAVAVLALVRVPTGPALAVGAVAWLVAFLAVLAAE